MEVLSINIIERLRKLQCAEGEVRDANHEAICGVIEAYRPDGYSVEKVHNEFEEGGRWSNYKINVYKIDCDGEVAYFELWEEVPASEMQEGGDFSYGFYEVVPKEVTVVQYVVRE